VVEEERSWSLQHLQGMLNGEGHGALVLHTWTELLYQVWVTHVRVDFAVAG